MRAESSAFLYGAAVALSASVVSLTGVILAGPFIGPGERFEEAGLMWLYAQPMVLALSAASMLLCRYYRATKTWRGAATFFVVNVLAVAAASLLMTRVLPVALMAW